MGKITLWPATSDIWEKTSFFYKNDGLKKIETYPKKYFKCTDFTGLGAVKKLRFSALLTTLFLAQDSVRFMNTFWIFNIYKNQIVLVFRVKKIIIYY